MDYSTEQEQVWAGEFGDAYVARNLRNPDMIASNIHFFSDVLRHTHPVNSILEFGCNVGQNLIALRRLLPKSDLAGIEINEKAVIELRKLSGITVYAGSIQDFQPDTPRDLVFTKGVLIHINPESLPAVYKKLYDSSSRYILLAEHYNRFRVQVEYTEKLGLLWRANFAGEMHELYPELDLVDYGFVYRHDKNFPQDDITWFLLEKR